MGLAWLFTTVQALREIAAQVGKKDWNFNVNPCNHSNWQTPKSSDRPMYNNTLLCNCTALDGVCHVIKLYNFLPSLTLG